MPFCLKIVSGGRLLEGASLVSTGRLWSQVGYSVNKLIWRPCLPFRTVGLKDGRACEMATVTQVSSLQRGDLLNSWKFFLFKRSTVSSGKIKVLFEYT